MKTIRALPLITLLALLPACRLQPPRAPDTDCRLLPAVTALGATNSDRPRPAGFVSTASESKTATAAIAQVEGVREPDGHVVLASHQSAPAGGEDAPAPLTLDQALDLSLEQNPNLVTLRAGQEVAHAAYHVAERYPWNPYVQVQVLPYSREANGNLVAVSDYVLLFQTLELAHQQRHRESSAAAAYSQVQWNVVQAELANVAQTESLFFTALYQRDIRNLARETDQLRSDLLEIVRRRYQATLSTPAELTTAQVTARQSRKQAALAEANYQTAMLALKRQLNVPADQPLAIAGRLADFRWQPIGDEAGNGATEALPLPTGEDMVAQAARQRPDVLAAAAGAEVASANLRLAKANTVPNLIIGPIYEHDDVGTVLAGFRSQMDVRIWNNGHPLVAQRQAELRQQQITLNQQQQRAVVEAQTALDRYRRARQLVQQERGELAETAPDDLQRIKRQFQAGQTDILSVYAVQNGLLQEQRNYLDLLNELAQAAADLTLTTGLAPDEILILPSAPQEDVLPPRLPGPGRIP